MTTHLSRSLALTATMVATLGLVALPVWADTTVTRKDGKTVVKAPMTRVETSRSGSGRNHSDRDQTKVRVRAPHTAVDVDTARRHVRIRVPYYSGDIRW